jgi:exonuclease III
VKRFPFISKNGKIVITLNNLRLLTINVRGLQYARDKKCPWLSKDIIPRADIITIQETHLLEDDLLIINMRKKYNIHSQGESTNSGGLLTISKKKLGEIQLIEKNNFCLITSIPKTNTIILNIYLNSSDYNLRSQQLDKIENFIINNQTKNLVIMGDFNISLLKIRIDSEKLRSLIVNNNLINRGGGITHSQKTKNGKSNRKIDYIFTRYINNKTPHSKAYTISKTLSDHHPLLYNPNSKRNLFPSQFWESEEWLENMQDSSDIIDDVHKLVEQCLNQAKRIHPNRRPHPNNTKNKLKKYLTFSFEEEKPEWSLSHDDMITSEPNTMVDKMRNVWQEHFAAPQGPYQRIPFHIFLSGPSFKILDKVIKKNIKDINKKTTPGPDNCPISALAAIDNITSKVIKNTIEKLAQNHKPPKDFNLTNMIMIPKVTPIAKTTEIRPIAISNISNRIVARTLGVYIKKFYVPLLHQSQIGFTPKKRIQQHLIDFVILREKHLNNRIPLFIDFSGAYDSIRRDRMFTLLKKMNFDKTLLKIIKNLNSKQFATINHLNAKSLKFEIRKGVKQGCPLSPFLFNICIDGLIRELNSIGPTLAFADDIVIFVEPHKIETCLEIFKRHMDYLGMELNSKKCGLLPPTTNYVIPNSYNIPTVYKYKYLGITFESNPLSIDWSPTITKLHNLTNITISNVINRINYYNTFIIPMLAYPLMIFNPPIKIYQNMIKRINNFINRLKMFPSCIIQDSNPKLYLSKYPKSLAEHINKMREKLSPLFNQRKFLIHPNCLVSFGKIPLEAPNKNIDRLLQNRPFPIPKSFYGFIDKKKLKKYNIDKYVQEKTLNTLTLALLNGLPINARMYHIIKNTTNQCPRCGLKEDIKHFLENCEYLQKIKEILKTRYNVTIPTISNMLQNPKLLDVIRISIIIHVNWRYRCLQAFESVRYHPEYIAQKIATKLPK